MLSCFLGGRRAQLLHEVHEALAVADLRHPRLGQDGLDLVVAHLEEELHVVVAVVDERLGVLGEVASNLRKSALNKSGPKQPYSILI